VVADEENRSILEKTGWVVWLTCELEVLKDRMKKEQALGNLRPSLTGTDPVEELEQVLDSRRTLYERTATLTVDTTTRTVPEVAALIKEALTG